MLLIAAEQTLIALQNDIINTTSMFGMRSKKSKSRRAAQPVRRRAVVDDSSPSAGTLFRRNRTLTGSLISSVPSPNEQSASLQSPRVQAHNLKRKRRSIRLALISALVLIAGLGWLLTQIIVEPKVQIVGTSNDPEVQTAARDYAAAIQDYLSANPLERLAVNINANNLSRAIQSRYPEVSSVSPPAKGALWLADFSVNLRSPVVYWQSGNMKAYVDSTGVVFERNILGTSVIAVEDQTGIRASVGNSVISGRFLQFIGKVVGHFKENNFTVNKMILPASTTRQLLVSLDGVGYSIKMTVDRPAAGQVEDAVRAIRYLTNRGITAGYIDVRVSRRAFYK